MFHMKKRKKRAAVRNRLGGSSPSTKMSQLVGEYASDYINMGDGTEERQSLLNAACSAWNIAVLPEHLREQALRYNIEQYRKINHGIDDSDNLAHDLQILIQKKLRMFPNVKKVIIDALIEPISNTHYRNIVSTDNPKQLIEMLTTRLASDV